MPKMDGTGPSGEGSGTGRLKGICRFDDPNKKNNRSFQNQFLNRGKMNVSNRRAQNRGR